MKKLICLLLAISVLCFAGCGKKTEETDTKTKNDKEVVSEEKKETKNEFVKLMETDKRPIAVMIDNDGPSSRPQIGLEKAFVLYEAIVEGGASRIMAIFKDASDIEKVGPVRSSRHYFLDYALEHDAIYCHAGWSPKAASDIKSLGVNNINGVTSDGSVFYRDSTYDNTWHNLYTTLNKTYDYAKDKKDYRTTTDTKVFSYSEKDFDIKDGQDATEINLPYSTMYKVNYKYDAENKIYTRYIGQSEHMSQTGKALTAKNIIVCKVKNYDLNDGENKGRQNLDTVGSGSGYYITNGKMTPITWTKNSRTGKTIYENADGEEIALNPGNTYVQIMPLTSEITIK
jgi:hypothetical protein